MKQRKHQITTVGVMSGIALVECADDDETITVASDENGDDDNNGRY